MRAWKVLSESVVGVASITKHYTLRGILFKGINEEIPSLVFYFMIKAFLKLL